MVELNNLTFYKIQENNYLSKLYTLEILFLTFYNIQSKTDWFLSPDVFTEQHLCSFPLSQRQEVSMPHPSTVSELLQLR